jgi:hypothetical protein
MGRLVLDTGLHRRHLIAGFLFVVLGGMFAGISLKYKMGTAHDMGPGFLPFWLGLALAVLGLVAMVRAWSAAPDALPIRVEPKQFFLIIGSILSFGLLLFPIGLIGAVIVMTLIASSASDEFRLTGAIGTALVLAAMAVGIFAFALDLPLPLVPEALADWRP